MDTDEVFKFYARYVLYECSVFIYCTTEAGTSEICAFSLSNRSSRSLMSCLVFGITRRRNWLAVRREVRRTTPAPERAPLVFLPLQDQRCVTGDPLLMSIGGVLLCSTIPRASWLTLNSTVLYFTIL